MTELSIIGLNHKSAPIDIRERFSLDAAEQMAALSDLEKIADESVILCTCNRTEFIVGAIVEEQHRAVCKLIQSIGNLSDDEFSKCFYVHEGRMALTHLFRVAAGLDSMVPGESQILGQIKSAVELSSKRDCIKGNFRNIYQQMLNTVKKVRTNTRLGHGKVSVGSVAVQLARNIFDTLFDKTVLLIGAGEMCEIAGDNFRQYGVEKILVANRSLENARRLAEKYEGEAFDLVSLPDVIAKADIVLSSVSDQPELIDRSTIATIMKGRSGLPLFIIDIAMPRNVAADVNDVADAYLYNIDDLQNLVEENLQDRLREAAKGEKIVRQDIDQFLLQTTNGKIAGPLIQSLQERVALVKAKELNRLYNRNPDLSPEDRSQVEQTVNQIVNKILHDPIISLRRELRNESEHLHITRIFKDFFNL